MRSEVKRRESFCACLCRNGQKLVDETTEKIRNHQVSSGQYKFLSTLLNRKDLSYKDVSILALSLLSDGLNTVCPLRVYVNCKIKGPV